MVHKYLMKFFVKPDASFKGLLVIECERIPIRVSPRVNQSIQFKKNLALFGFSCVRIPPVPTTIICVSELSVIVIRFSVSDVAMDVSSTLSPSGSAVGSVVGISLST